MRKADIQILVVDDQKDVRTNIKKTLQLAGYSVGTAVDCRNAIDKLNANIFHLVISDLYMPDFGDQFSPRAGLDLLHKIRDNFPECFIIMLSGAGEIRHALEARDYGIPYVEKGPSQISIFLQVVEQTIQINLNLKINYGHGTSLIHIEDEEILRRLYIDASEINISLIATGPQKTAVYRITARDLDGKWRVAQAVKISWKDRIQNETDNYHAWVEGRIRGERYPHLIGSPVYTRRRGGMIMRFLNVEWDGLGSLQNFYLNNDTQTILKAINNLFDNTLSFWHEDKTLEVLLLVQAYVRYWKVDEWDLLKNKSRYLREFAGQKEIYLDEIGVSFPNPVSLFQKILQSPYDFETRTYVATVHGDLHTSNVMVDRYLNCWLLDFSGTGSAHILRDFIELETSIKFSAFNDKNLKELCQFEVVLEAQNSLYDPVSYLGNDEELQKALATIKLIRKKAADVMLPKFDVREYYIGLLFHTMMNLRFLGKKSSNVKRKIIIYSAWLIIDKLHHLGFRY